MGLSKEQTYEIFFMFLLAVLIFTYIKRGLSCATVVVTGFLAAVVLRKMASLCHDANQIYRSNKILEKARVSTEVSPSKVLCFMNYDTDQGYEKYTTAINENYCAKHGYRFLRVHGYEKYPPWWRKVFILRDLFREGVSEDYVMWLDSDAAFTGGTDLPVSKLFAINPRAFFFVGKDPTGTLRSMITDLGNAGVFAVRNDERGRSFVETWARLYDPKRWCPPGADCPVWSRNMDKRKWRTDGPWAGTTYEQGAMNELMKMAGEGVAVYPEHVLSHRNAKYIGHLMGMGTGIRVRHFAEVCKRLGIQVS